MTYIRPGYKNNIDTLGEVKTAKGIIRVWPYVYEELVYGYKGYKKHPNVIEELKRQEKFCSLDVMKLIIRLGVAGPQTQGELGNFVLNNTQKSDPRHGQTIKKWCEMYLQPMGIVSIKQINKNNQPANEYSLTPLGFRAVLIFEQLIGITEEQWR